MAATCATEGSIASAMSLPRRKYGNRKVELDGVLFDSRKEANRWAELVLMERAGEISHLRRQVTFTLIPVQKDPETGKVIERDCKYIADFVYTENGKTVVEDTKGFRTPDYIIKRKLMLRDWGIRIREV
jgi:hypothetical protein